MSSDVVRCFVMMPSGNHNEYERGEQEAQFVYDHIITQAVKKVYGDGVEIVRELDSQRPGAIDRSLISNIVQSDIAIVDITGHNPNVFLELGIRYGLRRNTTILLRQETTTIPFDVVNYRIVQYSVIFDGPEKSIERLINALQEARSSSATSDSLVYDVFPNLRVDFRADGDTHAQGVMPWDHYWQRVTDITQRLQIPTKSGSLFKPDVVLGISNGGMIFADLLARNLYLNATYGRSESISAGDRKPPIAVWSLWADRDADGESKIFDSPPNDAVCRSVIEWIREVDGQTQSATILLVDDIVATGFTSLAAIKYAQRQFAVDTNVYFLPLFNKDVNHNYQKIMKSLVWSHPAFDYDFEEIRKAHYTEYAKLPYLKDIR
ncbi:MAG TPA: phosphoribosyltransferase [Longimicrobiaceae bacterium]|nr:phosphoribosyltransferase [Longimicrobiaceae bacterium]